MHGDLGDGRAANASTLILLLISYVICGIILCKGGEDMEKLELTASLGGKEIKIRDYLRRLGFSTSLIARVKFDMVHINGAPVHMRAILKDGDRVTVYFPDEDSENIEPIDIPIDILYEDERILVVNKPTTMPTHPSRGNHLPTLANAVRAYFGAPFVFRGITRLDRDTSGIVLIAKDRLAAAALSEAMKRGEIEKTYLARVIGAPDPRSGRIDAPIEREAEGSIRRIVRPDGKNSVTEYNTLSTDNDGNALLEVRPITGRTHQIRVHMAHIGHPLKNDFLYGERTEDGTYRLHCSRLSFPHPTSGEIMTIECKNTNI